MEFSKKTMYVLMVALICVWGLDYIIAKNALEVFDPLSLLFFKYLIGFTMVLGIKLKLEGKVLIRKNDLHLLIICSISGEILYFFCEYSALDYLPVSLITIFLAFVPVLAVIIEKIVYKKNPTKVMIIGIFVSIAGISLVIGVDYDNLFNGRAIGYLLAIGAVCSWNVYNFVTASLHTKYGSATLTMTQLICTILILFPYAISHLPERELITPSVIFGLAYLGLFGACIGFLIQVKSLHILGPTATALFSNFLPVTATFFGWLFLNETIAPLQVVGGIVVIIAGYVVIKEKGKLEEKYEAEKVEKSSE